MFVGSIHQIDVVHGRLELIEQDHVPASRRAARVMRRGCIKRVIGQGICGVQRLDFGKGLLFLVDQFLERGPQAIDEAFPASQQRAGQGGGRRVDRNH